MFLSKRSLLNVEIRSVFRAHISVAPETSFSTLMELIQSCNGDIARQPPRLALDCPNWTIMVDFAQPADQNLFLERALNIPGFKSIWSGNVRVPVTRR